MDRIEEIKAEIERIAGEENVTIFFACESGSRAWGFESKDSDYDVRFLYFHPLDWYLSVEERRDVIERPINDDLDINGWELSKALRLLRKSNPPLLEWLQSPIIYKEEPQATSALKSLLPTYFSKRNCFYHYLHMAEGNYKEFLKSDMVRVKKYFYVLRPVLACIWIERFPEPVPMEFGKLVDRIIDDDELLTDLNDLLDRKRAGAELDLEPKIESINRFLDTQLALLNENKQERIDYTDYSELNSVFRMIVRASKTT